MLKMNEQFTRQAQEMFNAAKDARIPENVQAFAEDTVAKSREAFQRMNGATKDSVKVVEEIMLASHAGAKTIGEKMLHNTAVNTDAAFDAAQQMARAKSIQDLARLQADFFQQQMAAASAQTKELLELSTKVSRQTFESISGAAQRSFETMKKTS